MITDTTAEVRKLQLFNRKSKKLENSTFAKKVFDEPSGVTTNFEVDKSVTTHRYGPDEEAIDAFLLTLRLFIGKKEQISLIKTGEMYETLPVDSQISAKFKEVTDVLNEFLSSPISNHSAVKAEFNGIEPTRQELITFIIFGDLAHVDENKRGRFIEWEENPIAFPYAQNAFVVTLATYLNAISWLRELNELALKELETSTP